MQFIKLDLSNAIASIKLQHAGGNRINFQMREEIFNAVESVAKSDARVLVIKGDGEDFCLGGDVRDWPDMPVDKLRPRVEVFANALDRLEQLDIPTIASVQGGCAGGGFELALACDMIIASRSARFSFPEALIGIMTLQGGVYNIAERIGRTKAVELAFLSDPAPAEQLAQWNVVNRVVDDEALIPETDGLAQRLATGPAMVYAATKELLRIWQSEGVRGARKALYDISMPLFGTDDTQRALHNVAAAVNAGQPIPRAIFSAGPKDRSSTSR
jgi:enoyl-CoA hydratase/carnithine racemase